MSDNYDGPALAQQIIRLQSRVKELTSQVETCRENEVRLALENRKLKRAVEAARYCVAQIKDQKGIWPAEVDTLEDALREMDA